MPPDSPQPGFGGPFNGGAMHHALGLRGGLFLVFLVLLLVVAVVALLLSVASRRRGATGVAATSQRGPSFGGGALRILDERLARGEITADEYASRRNVLSGQA